MSTAAPAKTTTTTGIKGHTPPKWAGGWLKWVFIALAFAIVGSIYYFNFRHVGAGVSNATYTQTDTACSAVIRTVEYAQMESAPYVIAPGGANNVQWGVEGGRVGLIDHSGKKIEVGPEGGSFTGFWTESVVAVSGTPRFHYKLAAC